MPTTEQAGIEADRGLALLSIARRPGEALTLEEIAAWCECRPSTIHRIERRALAKVRASLHDRLARQITAELERAEPLAGGLNGALPTYGLWQCDLTR